jgi:membrane-associated phospholipid phosphatase
MYLRKKIIPLSFLPFLFSACSSKLFAQPAVLDTTNNFPQRHYLKPSALIIPGTFLLYGGLKPAIKGIQNLDNNIMSHILQNHPSFHTNAADYVMWVPSASLYFTDALKVKTMHSFGQHLIIDAGSIIITGGLGYGMRLITRNVKVYNEKGTKFPSGHTANAFRGAEILHQELKERNKLLSYGGYVAATAVGVLRIYDKDHLLSEVLAGAGLGILSTKLTYWIFDKVKYKAR